MVRTLIIATASVAALFSSPASAQKRTKIRHRFLISPAERSRLIAPCRYGVRDHGRHCHRRTLAHSMNEGITPHRAVVDYAPSFLLGPAACVPRTLLWLGVAPDESRP